MKINLFHSFELDFARAKEIQMRLACRLIIKGGPALDSLKTVAGCDVAFEKKNNIAFGAVVVLSYPELEIVEVLAGTAPVRFPYVPGFLSFREIEVLLPLFETLRKSPELVLIDGQGIAHPRGIGLASHLGLFLDVPTVGCAKSRLVGNHAEVGSKKGDGVPIMYKSKRVGTLLRTRDNVKPMYISPGHLVGVKRAEKLALACTGKFRMPEPTRQAHIAVTKYKGKGLGFRDLGLVPRQHHQ